jgi:hypothetical protein
VRAIFDLQEAILAARQGQWSDVDVVLATILGENEEGPVKAPP